MKSTECAYLGLVASFVHPNLDDVSLAVALHALSDPARLAMIVALDAAGALNCTATVPCGAIPKSTLSNHLRILRGAGLVETRSAGREMHNTLRRADFERRFPGLLDAILANRPPP
ncbi:ArsR/SmtB family transcription factor [Sphingomonas sp. PAMC 26605]|uniref:ArsR/SmtB family transcription factor n=1 Tax=Sphingomonas sp. PAMC 26605 TaxID=1112214 RepID=UPI00026CA1BC|nr:helix-turn-helix domain-containing protein [Sphingomonas sp. PAMC 26605]